jgi:hypothetical protein
MPQKEACENQIPDETEVRKEWQFDYRGVSDLIRGRKRGPRSLRNKLRSVHESTGYRAS